jgi:hypothetical protein
MLWNHWQRILVGTPDAGRQLFMTWVYSRLVRRPVTSWVTHSSFVANLMRSFGPCRTANSARRPDQNGKNIL